MTTADRAVLHGLLARERFRFEVLHPRSRALGETTARSLLGGVPMNWMRRWPGPFPSFAVVTDRVGRRITMMLPTDDAARVGGAIGKPIGGGIPAAVHGMTAAVAEHATGHVAETHTADVSGIGGTLSGNALALAAVRATLGAVLTDDAFVRMEELAIAWAAGVQATIDRHRLPRHVNRLGCRAEYWFCPPPRTGADAARAVDVDLDAYLHLACLSEGILLTPFHNMALMSPATTRAMVDHDSEAFGRAVDELVRTGAVGSRT